MRLMRLVDHPTEPTVMSSHPDIPSISRRSGTLARAVCSPGLHLLKLHGVISSSMSVQTALKAVQTFKGVEGI